MKQALIVLGMHRSGTSSVAGALSKLGATAPRTLMPEHPDNPKGYWESLPIVQANDQILASAGSSWNDWRPFNPNWVKSAAGQGYSTSLPGLIREEFNGAPLIVLKDPRLCRLFPLWSLALESAGYAPLVLVPLRSPVEVAASLARRDGFSEARGLMIWLRHVLDAEYASRKTARHFLLWTDFIADWRSEIAKASQGLDVIFPSTSDFAENAVDQFLDINLRRAETPLEWPTHVQSWVKETWDILVTLTGAPHDSEALKKLDTIREKFDQSAKMFGPVFVGMETEKHLWAVEHQEEAATLRIRLSATEHERDQQMIARADTETLLKQYIEKLDISESSNSEMSSENFSLSKSLSETRELLSESQGSLKEAIDKIDEQKNDHVKLIQDYKLNKDDTDELRAENRSLLEDRELLISNNSTAILNLNAAEKEKQAAQADLVSARTQILSLSRDLDETKNNIAQEREEHEKNSNALSNQYDELKKILTEKTAALYELELKIEEMRATESVRAARNPFRRLLSK